MKSNRISAGPVIAALALASVSQMALAQTTTTANSAQAQPSVGERIRAILGNILGDRSTNNSTLNAQWAAGRTPLADQRYEFESRVDAEVRARNLTAADGDRLKSDYRMLVDTEARYGADGNFSVAERDDLSRRYTELINALQRGSYGGVGAGVGTGVGSSYDTQPTVAQGETEFRRRVDSQLAARRISRTEATRLRNDYAALVRLESDYLRDGYIDSNERAELDRRLDALDVRVGDTGYGNGGYQTTAQRLDAVARAVPTAGLSSSARAQLQVELEDIRRLEAAYSRLSPTAEERAYLERRVSDLETRARIRR